MSEAGTSTGGEKVAQTREQADSEALKRALLAVFAGQSPPVPCRETRPAADHTALRCRSMQVFKTSS